MKIINDGAGLIIGLEELDLDKFPRLRCIGCNMTSTEHLPMERIRRRAIKFFSLKDYPFFLREITSTAEHAVGLMLSLLRNYPQSLNSSLPRDIFVGHKLKGKAIGIIGSEGRVGRQVAQMLFGFEVIRLGYDLKDKPEKLDKLLELSDIITIHIPLEGNRNFFSRGMFEAMKPESYLINTSRAEVVDNSALTWALENNIIAGAAVDFLTPELLSYAKTHNNLILTNHQGGNTFEDRKLTEDFIENLVQQYLNETI